jgi:glycine/D-amino acid oxidase-like deaminating enzyme
MRAGGDAHMPEVLVIGGGAGAFAAATLARHGFRVTLVERSGGLMTGASARTGRRLHLGEHYSADVLPADDQTTVNTGRLCFLGACALAAAFPRILNRDPQWWQLIPVDSMTTPDQYEEHLAGLRTFHRTLSLTDPRVDQFFGPAHHRHRRLDPQEYRTVAPPDAATAGYASRESVIDVVALRRGLTAVLAATGARVSVNTEVIEVRPRGGGYEAWLRDVRTDERVVRRYDCVVNATWHEIPTLSGMVSTVENRRATSRLKLLVTSRIPATLAALPSSYFHRGVYGNHTNVAGRYAIVTAEEISNLSFAQLNAMPATWGPLISGTAASGGELDEQWLALNRLTEGDPDAGSTGGEHARYAIRQAVRRARSTPRELRVRAARYWLGREVLKAYSTLVPAFREAEPLTVRFTTVVSGGDAHLANPKSRVHMRGFSVSEVAPNFFDLDPGKLTFVQLTAEHLCRCLLSRHHEGRARLPAQPFLKTLDQAHYFTKGPR